jgi:hypothetical protein
MFNAFVAERLALGDPLDFRPFDAWRSRADRARLWADAQPSPPSA